MFKPLARCKSSSLSKKTYAYNEVKVFTRNNKSEDQKIFYQEGVNQILNNRRILSLSKDTTFLAIDIFKGCVKKKLISNSRYVQLFYITCVYIAAKLNQVLTLTVQEAIDGFDSFAKKQDIFRIQIRILNSYQFQIPFEENITTYISQIVRNYPDRKIIQNNCLKTILQSIGDSYFLNVENKDIAYACICIYYPQKIKKNGLANKVLIPIIGKLKKIQKQKISIKQYTSKKNILLE